LNLILKLFFALIENSGKNVAAATAAAVAEFNGGSRNSSRRRLWFAILTLKF